MSLDYIYAAISRTALLLNTARNNTEEYTGPEYSDTYVL
jgi:hypothetical protein